MSQRNKDGYSNVIFNSTKNDTYLVKTKEGTYEFAFFDGENWNIQGDNNGATVRQ